jgi:undecaprenyl-diphosphatase
MSGSLAGDRTLRAVAATGAGLAALLLAAVISGKADPLDRAAFLWLHGSDIAPAMHPAWLRDGVRDVTALGSFIVLTAAVLGAAAYLLAARRWRLALLLVSSAVCATLVSTVLKVATDRGRPDLVDHAVGTITASFPSGHAFLSAAILLTLAGLLSRASARDSQRRVILACAALLAVAVGLSRIYLGVHWPTDVLAGWLLGSAWAAGTLLAARRAEQVPARDQSSGRGVHVLSK